MSSVYTVPYISFNDITYNLCLNSTILDYTIRRYKLIFSFFPSLSGEWLLISSTFFLRSFFTGLSEFIFDFSIP